MGNIMKVRNEYRLTITAKCPVDPTYIHTYDVIVQSKEVVEVETILKAVTENTAAPVFQEHLTMKLAAILKAKVTTSGTHSGVFTISTATFPG